MKASKWIVVLSLAASAALAQDDVVARARQLATTGNRADATRLLDQHLAAQPNDLDARTLLGTVLSWDGQYDRARQELRRVVSADPKNLDARIALIRTEIWSGHRDAAQSLVSDSLALFPGNGDLMALQQQARGPAAAPHQQVVIGFNYDNYKDSDAWREGFAALTLGSRVGPVIARASHAHRFGNDDNMLELEAYPRLAARTYAYLAGGWSPDAKIYPRSRFGAEVFHGFGEGWEASAGARRLNFPDAVNIYTGSLSKYVKAWLFTGRVYATSDTTSGYLMACRYFGPEGQYVSLRAGRGSLGSEIRSSADVESLDVWEIAAEAMLIFGGQWSVNFGAGAGRGRYGRGDRTTSFVAIGRRF